MTAETMRLAGAVVAVLCVLAVPVGAEARSGGWMTGGPEGQCAIPTERSRIERPMDVREAEALMASWIGESEAEALMSRVEIASWPRASLERELSPCSESSEVSGALCTFEEDGAVRLRLQTSVGASAEAQSGTEKIRDIQVRYEIDSIRGVGRDVRSADEVREGAESFGATMPDEDEGPPDVSLALSCTPDHPDRCGSLPPTSSPITLASTLQAPLPSPPHLHVRRLEPTPEPRTAWSPLRVGPAVGWRAPPYRPPRG